MACKRILLGLIFSMMLLETTRAEEHIQPLGVNNAVEIALANNLNLRLQREEVDRNQGGVLVEKGEFDAILAAELMSQEEQKMSPVAIGSPQQETFLEWNTSLQKKMTFGSEFSLSWQNNRTDTDSSFTLLNPSYYSGVIFSLRQPLLKGRGVEVQTANLRAARRQVEAEIFLVDSRAADLAAEVKKAYWELVFAGQDIEVKNLSLTLAKKLRDETREKIVAKVMAPVEIYEPESEVALREKLLIQGERAIGAAEDDLKLLLNSNDWGESLVTSDLPQLSGKLPNLEQVLQYALNNRPDIKAADLKIKAAHITVNGARNRTLPSLDLSGAVGVSGTDNTYGNSLDNVSNRSDTMWQVGLVLSVPLGNYSAEGNYRQAKANLAQAEIRAELVRQQVRRSAREAVRDVRLAVKGVEAAEKTTLATMKRLEAEQEKFPVGLATANNVLEAQTAYAEALSSEHRFRAEYAMAMAELDRIQGLITLDKKLGEQVDFEGFLQPTGEDIKSLNGH
ncbi:MAG: TolC family protein [Desulfobulbaceae bacterium]|nr:TolC family protein [Desulfobulbaceae bacterium]